MTGDRWVLPAELRELAECGETGIVQEVLTVFVSDSTERISAMRAACAPLDRERLRKQGHALKGSSGQVGAVALAALCKALETTAEAASHDEITALIGRIDGEFREIARAMEQAG
jgi:HPt (histidine-containing phosphotransfer) domain-containing protein